MTPREAEHRYPADGPSEIPAEGWKDVAVQVKQQVRDDHVPLLAAGVALYFLLALVPALVAVIAVYGLVASPADIQSQIADFAQAAPQEVRDLLASQLRNIASGSNTGSLLGLVLGIGGAVWAASSGMKHLISAVNAVYDETEDRGFVALRGLALVFTLGAMLLFIVAVGVIAVLPQLVGDLPGAVSAVVRWVPYALLAAVFAVALGLVYRYAPNRQAPRVQWVSWGAVIGTLLWIAASIGFSFYVANFGSYNETYGSLGAVVVLILWLLITSYAVLIGAEINAQLETETTIDIRDESEQEPAPAGARRT